MSSGNCPLPLDVGRAFSVFAMGCSFVFSSLSQSMPQNPNNNNRRLGRFTALSITSVLICHMPVSLLAPLNFTYWGTYLVYLSNSSRHFQEPGSQESIRELYIHTHIHTQRVGKKNITCQLIFWMNSFSKWTNNSDSPPENPPFITCQGPFTLPCERQLV